MLEHFQVAHVFLHELFELAVVLAGRAATDRQNSVDIRVIQELAKRALPYHAARAEQDHFHVVSWVIARVLSRPDKLDNPGSDCQFRRP